jgi:acetyl-CoA carboxylase carboxyltransferase component
MVPILRHPARRWFGSGRPVWLGSGSCETLQSAGAPNRTQRTPETHARRPKERGLDQKLIGAIHEARARGADNGRGEAIARVHASGHLSARERVARLLDPGSAVELGALQGRTEWGWAHTLGGVDFIGTVEGRPVVTSSTDYSDHGGGYGAGQLARLFSLAKQERWPCVLFVDGGGSRAQSLEGTGARIDRLAGRYPGGTGFFEGLAALAGWVPLIAVVSGPSFAGHATLAAFCDVIFTTRGSSIGMGGPPMVEAAFGTKLTPTELAPVEMHEEKGGIDLLLASEEDAIAAAKRFLSYYYDEGPGRAPTAGEEIARLVPEVGPYDVRAVVEAIADAGSVFELRPRFAPNLVTAFIRIEGRSVGVIASQPRSHEAGAIDQDAADKVARWVQLCDGYGLPILSLVDTPGTVIRTAEGLRPGMTRRHARAIKALHHRTCPLVSVQLRQGRGLGAAVMTGVGSAHTLPLQRLAWPTVELGAVSPYSQGFDDVIDPAETRGRLSTALRLAPRRIPAEKRRPRDSW